VLEFFGSTEAAPAGEVMEVLAGVCAQVARVMERKRAEKALVDTSALQRAILDGASFSVIYTRPDGVIEVFNRAAQRWFGRAADEVIGKATLAIFHQPQQMAARAQ